MNRESRCVRSLVLALGMWCALCNQAAAQAWDPNNIVVSTGNGRLKEYTRAGGLVRDVAVPNPPAGDDVPFSPDNRAVGIGPDGRAHIFNGTFDPYLATYNPVANSWVQNTFAGWSTVNNVSYGGVAAWTDGGIFVSDMITFGTGDQPSGIVRFDGTTFSGSRFGTDREFRDLTLGLDGRLYGLGSSGVAVYDPSSQAFIREFALQGFLDTRGIAVAADGSVFGADWSGNITKYAPDGTVVTTLDTALGNMYDIAIHPDGTLIASDRDGLVLLSTIALSSQMSFDATPGQFEGAFVSFAAFVPAPSGVLLMGLVGLAAGRRVRR